MIKVLLPIHTVSVMNAREHWSKRAKRAKIHRTTARAMLAQWAGRPELPITVSMTRISAGTLDGDNLQSALKATRDGIADWLRLDDADPRVTWAYDQQRGKEKEYGVIVRVA